MTTFTPTNQPFLKYLNVQKTPYLFLTAETDDFDEILLEQWTAEGFVVNYVPLGDGGAAYIQRLHSAADSIVGVSEYYAIVAYGEAATACLESHIKPTPRLCALIAYYPTAIPEPSRTRFPMQTSILVHLTGREVGVRRTPEVLGIQGKRKTVRRRVDPGLGLGGELRLAFPTYTYAPGVESGFAEHDLDEFDGAAAGVAWSRSLGVVRRAFGMEADVERAVDQHVVDSSKDPQKAVAQLSKDAQVLYTPTLTGGANTEDIESFYTTFFSPCPADLNTRLLSRTVGVDRVVDEIALSFQHNKQIDWLLPGIPPTNRHVEIVIVSIVCVRGGRLHSEHVYWDQASVLVQVGLLDPKLVPKKFKEDEVERLPVLGVESARAVRDGKVKGINNLIPDW